MFGTYAYDGDGKRATRTASIEGTTTTYRYVYDINKGLPVVLTDGHFQYVWGLGLHYLVDGSGNAITYHANGQGSIVAVSESAGHLVNTYGQDLWGDAGTVETTTLKYQPFRYTGEQADAESGLMYLRARYYDPAAGRFMSRDTFGGFAKKSQNRYAYTGNDPVTASDPSGHAPDPNFTVEYDPDVIDPITGNHPLIGRKGYWVPGDDVYVIEDGEDLLDGGPGAAQAFGKNLIVSRGTLDYKSRRYYHEFGHIEQIRDVTLAGECQSPNGCRFVHERAAQRYGAVLANAKDSGTPWPGGYANERDHPFEDAANRYAEARLAGMSRQEAYDRRLYHPLTYPDLGFFGP